MPICFSDIGKQPTLSPSIFCNFPHNRNFAHYASSYIVLNLYNGPSKYYYFPSLPGKVKYSEAMCFT